MRRLCGVCTVHVKVLLYYINLSLNINLDFIIIDRVQEVQLVVRALSRKTLLSNLMDHAMCKELLSST